MSHPLDLLVRKLSAACKLSGDDRDAILALPHTTKDVSKGAHLLREGDEPVQCTVLVRGFAYRHKIAADGKRQIVSIHVPGEALEFQSLYLNYVDHNAQTMTDAEIAIIPMATLRDLLGKRPVVAQAVIQTLLVDASISREWLVNVGTRSARARVAHLLCEYAVRVNAQGLSGAVGYTLLMTQEQIGDALGLTGAHVNRSMRSLVADKVIRREGRVFSFPDIERLKRLADFSPLYLHLPA